MSTPVAPICKGCGLPITGTSAVIFPSGYFYHQECTHQIGAAFYPPTSGAEIARLRSQLEAEKAARVKAESDLSYLSTVIGTGFLPGDVFHDSTIAARALRAADAHKAVGERDKLQAALDGIASALHYPECWDTAAYPNLESAIFQGFQCAVCAEPEIHGYPKDWATTRKPEVK